jgi:hypothetical protein
VVLTSSPFMSKGVACLALFGRSHCGVPEQMSAFVAATKVGQVGLVTRRSLGTATAAILAGSVPSGGLLCRKDIA